MQTATSAVLTCAAAGVNAFAALNAVFRAFRVRYSGESGHVTPSAPTGTLDWMLVSESCFTPWNELVRASAGMCSM
jgi:hypothetical protein